MTLRILYARFSAAYAPPLGASFQMMQGEDIEFLFVTESPPTSLAGWSAVFNIRSADGVGIPVLTKTVGSGIALTDPINGIITVTLSAADTIGLTLQSTPWVWQLNRTDAGNNCMLAKGTMGIAFNNIVAGIPSQPTGFAIPTKGNGNVLVSWTAGANSTSSVLQRSPDNITWTTVQSSALTSYVENATTGSGFVGKWYFQVQGVNAEGSSSFTPSINASPFTGFTAFPQVNGTSLAGASLEVGTIWSVNSGTWSVLSHAAVASVSGDITTDVGTPNYNVTATFAIPTGIYAAGLVMRYADENNNYQVVLEQDSFGGPYLQILSRISGTQTVAAGPVTLTLTPPEACTLLAQVNGSTIAVYLNGAPVLQYAGATSGTSNTKIGLVESLGGGFQAVPISNFSVTGFGANALQLYQAAGLYQDLFGTTPSVSNGDRVGRWKDQLGNGWDVFGLGSTKSPVYHPSRGTVEIEIASGSNPPGVLLEEFQCPAYTIDRQNSSFFMILEPASLRGAADGVHSFQPYTIPAKINDTGGNWVLVWAGQDSFANPGQLSVLDDVQFQYGPNVLTSRCLVGAIMGPSNCTIVVNGQSTVVSAMESGVSQGLHLSISATASQNYGGSIVKVYGYDHPLSNTELAALRTEAQSLGCVFTSNAILCIDGDSISEGVNSTLCQNWPRQLGLASTPLQYNVAQAGQTLQTMLADRVARVDPLIQSGALNVLIVFAGINDLAGGRTAAQALSDLISYCTGAKTAGWNKLIVGTTLPWATGSLETARLTLNSSIRSQSFPPWDYIADWGNDPTMGQSGENTNAMYFGADELHPLSAGYLIGAGYFKAALVSAGIT